MRRQRGWRNSPPAVRNSRKSLVFHRERALSIVRGWIIDRWDRKRKSYYRVSIRDITGVRRVCRCTVTGERGVYVLRGCIDKAKFTSPGARAALIYYRSASSSLLHIHACLPDEEGKTTASRGGSGSEAGRRMMETEEQVNRRGGEIKGRGGSKEKAEAKNSRGWRIEGRMAEKCGDF